MEETIGKERKRRPCASCPFREGAALGYDADAMEWLDKGHEPSCHKFVGLDGIFLDDFPSAKTRCAGYDAYMDERAGYCKPRATGKERGL